MVKSAIKWLKMPKCQENGQYPKNCLQNTQKGNNRHEFLEAAWQCARLQRTAKNFQKSWPKMAKSGKADEINKKKIQKKTAKGAHISPLMANFCDLRFPPPLPDVTPPGESLDKGGGEEWKEHLWGKRGTTRRALDRPPPSWTPGAQRSWQSQSPRCGPLRCRRRP